MLLLIIRKTWPGLPGVLSKVSLFEFENPRPERGKVEVDVDVIVVVLARGSTPRTTTSPTVPIVICFRVSDLGGNSSAASGAATADRAAAKPTSAFII